MLDISNQWISVNTTVHAWVGALSEGCLLDWPEEELANVVDNAKVEEQATDLNRLKHQRNKIR